ncbi:MAG: CHAT domain-containing protein [Nostoc sp.]|uniref:CHAT domain-containing protein n=1 Tax=Nostoc sp. TaxID=1180 RepID=UPI002FF979B7
MNSTILLLSASPLDQAKLRLDTEAREIEEGLRRFRHRDQFKLKKQGAVRIDDLRRFLLDAEPQIVHFCGHGTGEEGLVFEDQQGKTQLVSTDALTNLFELFAGKIECVVFNACYSEVQAKAIIQHVGYVIGMNKVIGDKAAIKFSIGFYDALGAGRSVEEAYKFGCNAIQSEGISEYLTPILKINTAWKYAVKLNLKPNFLTSTNPSDRFALIKLLNDLPPQQLDVLLISIKPTSGVIPPITAPQGDRTAALLRWAEGPTGCGFEQLQSTLNQILG